VLDALEGFRVVFIGHSMGGAVGVVRASSDERIARLVSLAGMVHTADFAAREFGEVTPDAGNMWDDEDCPLSQKYLDDMNQIHSVVERAAAIDMPWLLLHGTEDDVVPLQDSKDIVAKAGDSAELVIIDGADHVFSEHVEQMVEKVVGWVTAQLAQ
jgi:pimeloyl-ACP methyl ester carboxylesterase